MRNFSGCLWKENENGSLLWDWSIKSRRHSVYLLSAIPGYEMGASIQLNVVHFSYTLQ